MDSSNNLQMSQSVSGAASGVLTCSSASACAQKRGRGRPRKNQVINENEKNKKKSPNEIKKYVKELTEKETDEEIILHLPIFLRDVDNIKKNSVFEKKDSNSQNSNNNSNADKNTDKNTDKNAFTIDMNNELENMSSEENGIKFGFTAASNSNNNSICGSGYGSSNSSHNGDNDKNYIVSELKRTIKNQEKVIKKLQADLDNYKDVLTETVNNELIDRKATKMTCDFLIVDATTGKKIILEQTDIACWWCSYNFDTVPCLIPEKFHEKTYHVFGCFCSYNYAAAYNLYMRDSLIGNRYSLLKKMYNTIYNNSDDIHISPARNTFKKFGGTLTHEEFLKNCLKNNKEYRYIMPPMTSIVPIIEEGRLENKNNIKLSDLNKKNLILKRTKPLPNAKNNLFETFGKKN